MNYELKMDKKILFISYFIVAVAPAGWSQTVSLDFPKLSGNTAWIYYFTGSHADSLSVELDSQGKATVALPNSPKGGNVAFPQGYRGLAYLYIPQKGGGEFLLAENRVTVTCSVEQFNAGMLEFPQSEENEFMRWAFQWRGYLFNQKAENDKMMSAFGDKIDKSEPSSGFTVLQSYGLEMAELNEKAIQRLDTVIANSPLYAARFMELMGFMQNLYNTIQLADTVRQQQLKTEMEQIVDINALFHAGKLWTDIHSWYPGLFIGGGGKPVEEEYAASVGFTLRRLEEPVLTAFLSEALLTCERQNFQKAQEIMLSHFILMYPTLPITDPKVKRMIDALSLNKGGLAPSIAGLENSISQPAIIIFFDSDCDHCRDEITWLAEHYSELTAKGYRIISIAADIQQNNYQNFVATLPWDKADRLCDFKGMSGENFKNYGIVGTPTIFVVDKNGTIVGKYAQMKELNI